MRQKVAVPAATARKCAKNALVEADRLQEEDGHVNLAEVLREEATGILNGEIPDNPGQLVSLEAHVASSIAAHGYDSEYNDGFRKMLKHQHYW